jgi:DNA-binding response OmpR family regulator
MENSERPQINSKKILVLDDDHDLLELLHDAFILYGFDVDAYSDHISALKSFGSPLVFLRHSLRFLRYNE